MRFLVSACLLGENCKYSGGNNYRRAVAELVKGHEVIAVCPEVAAGLGIPRTPIEIRNGEVVSRSGESVDDAIRGAVAELLRQLPQNIDCCILKARSPTCGVHRIYDGTFSGTLVEGAGVLAQALLDAGYRVLDEEDAEIVNFAGKRE